MNKTAPMTVTVDRLGAQADGIAVTPQGPVYIPDALPGEELRVEITGRRGEGRAARIVERLSPAQAISPACRHFEACGGCVAQHLPAATYRSWKAEKIHTALARKDIAAPALTDQWFAPPGSRRRLTLAAKFASGRMLLGFSERRGKRIIDIVECPIAASEIVSILPDLRRLLSQTLGQKNAANVHLLAADNGLDLWCDDAGDLDLGSRERLVAFAEAADLARLSWGPAGETVVMRRMPRIAIGEYPVTPPPGAFLQATAASQKYMIDLAQENLAGSNNIADLFAGVGTFSLALAPGAAVQGFEADADAVAAFTAARNARASTNPVTVAQRDLYRRPLDAKELKEFDAAVIDPPKAGARDQFEALAGSEVVKILSVSCNPATFARDAKTLLDGGYEFQKLWLVDQFLWSAEVELIGLFARH